MSEIRSTKKKPSPGSLRLAAEWLRCYESDSGGLSETADWLDAQADAVELRAAAREHRVPVKKLRAAMGEKS